MGEFSVVSTKESYRQSDRSRNDVQAAFLLASAIYAEYYCRNSGIWRHLGGKISAMTLATVEKTIQRETRKIIYGERISEEKAQLALLYG